MKITNKAGLPEAFVNGIREERYQFKEDSYSATTIIHSPTEVLLQRRHDSEIEQDAVEMLNMIFGTAVHSWLEKYKADGTFAELYLKHEVIPGLYLSGMCDVYDSVNHKLIDWKTGTTYKVLKKDFKDWRLQGLIYAYLLDKVYQYKVEKIEFWCFMKDWSARERRQQLAKGYEYPETAAYCYEFVPTEADMVWIETYIMDWFLDVKRLSELPDCDLPYCGDENTWYSGNSYAVYKLKANGEKYATATRVLKTEDEAKDYIKADPKNQYVIEYRKGEYRKCQDYCSCCQWCSHYKKNVC